MFIVTACTGNEGYLRRQETEQDPFHYDGNDKTKDLEERHRIDMFEDGNTLLDFAIAVPDLSCPETQGVQKHERKHTQEYLRDRRNMTIVYVPHESGVGIKPVRITKQEAHAMKREAGDAV